MAFAFLRYSQLKSKFAKNLATYVWFLYKILADLKCVFISKRAMFVGQQLKVCSLSACSTVQEIDRIFCHTLVSKIVQFTEQDC